MSGSDRKTPLDPEASWELVLTERCDNGERAAKLGAHDAGRYALSRGSGAVRGGWCFLPARAAIGLADRRPSY
jgi:hypothetical protein